MVHDRSQFCHVKCLSPSLSVGICGPETYVIPNKHCIGSGQTCSRKKNRPKAALSEAKTLEARQN